MKLSPKKLNEKGQSSVEYLLIVAVLVVAIFAFGGKMKEGLTKITGELFDNVGTSLSNKLKQAE